MKNWSNFYPETIKSQFIKDLQKMGDLGDIRWIFNKTDNVSDLQILKNKVISSLKKANGSPIDELDNLFNSPANISRIQNIFGQDIINSSNLLRKLDDMEIFKKIFEVVE